MAEECPPSSESEEEGENSSSEEIGSDGGDDGGGQAVTEYEKQRLARIEENRARMGALGLRNLSSSLLGSARKLAKGKVAVKKKSGKDKGDEDEEYKPNEGDGAASSSSSEEGEEDERVRRRGSGRKGRRKSLENLKMPKNTSVQSLNGSDENNDDYDTLQQAIALSLDNNLKDLGGTSCGKSASPGNKGRSNIQEFTGRKKKRKLIEKLSRLQMTEDEMVAYFFSFDEAGKGSITLRDLRKMATAHDFIWTDKELADMISCFDPDGDGKLSLEDFRTIMSKCNMLRDP